MQPFIYLPIIIMKKITIDGEVYVLEKDIPKISTKAKPFKWMPYVMVRTYSAWVFAGYLESRKWKEGKLLKARRMWYRDWAASLSQLATDWTSKPSNCKFPCEVEELELTEIIEIMPITDKAKTSIDSVPVRKQ